MLMAETHGDTDIKEREAYPISGAEGDAVTGPGVSLVVTGVTERPRRRG